MRIGIIGGAFDPVHFGHLQTALEMSERLKLDKVLFFPTGTPPHRTKAAIFAQHRVKMLELAIAGSPNFIIDLFELNRTNLSFALHTAEYVKENFNPSHLYWIIGADHLPTLHTWHQFGELLKLTNFAVAKRAYQGLEAEAAIGDFTPLLHAAVAQVLTANFQDLYHSPAARIGVVTTTSMAISSTLIRTRCQDELPIFYLTPHAVSDYITAHSLYSHLDLKEQYES